MLEATDGSKITWFVFFMRLVFDWRSLKAICSSGQIGALMISSIITSLVESW
jgi:hypothetical protein